MTKTNYQFIEQNNTLTLRVFGEPKPNNEYKNQLIGVIISFCFFYAVLYVWFDGWNRIIDLAIGLYFAQAIYRGLKKQRWLKEGFEELQIKPLENKMVFFRQLNSVFDKTTISFENLKYLGGAERLNFPHQLKTKEGSWLVEAEKEGKFCFLFNEWNSLFKSRYIHYFGNCLNPMDVQKIEQRIYQFLNQHQVTLEIA